MKIIPVYASVSMYSPTPPPQGIPYACLHGNLTYHACMLSNAPWIKQSALATCMHGHIAYIESDMHNKLNSLMSNARACRMGKG